MIFQPLGKFLRSARERANLSGEELNEILNFPSKRIFLWELGTQAPALKYFAALEKALGLRPQALLDEYFRLFEQLAKRGGYGRGDKIDQALNYPLKSNTGTRELKERLLLQPMGEFLKKAREDKRISVETTSKTLGCHPQMIADWERGVIPPPLKYFSKIEHSFDLQEYAVLKKYLYFFRELALGIGPSK